MYVSDGATTGYPPPGTVVSIPLMLGYRHKGLVSDRWDDDGKPLVISGSARAGSVVEEPWDDFAAGKDVRNDGYPSALPPWVVLQRARGLVGDRKYDLFQWNCDHVVATAHGQNPESPQVTGTIAAAALVLVAGILATAKRRP